MCGVRVQCCEHSWWELRRRLVRIQKQVPLYPKFSENAREYMRGCAARHRRTRGSASFSHFALCTSKTGM